MTGLFKWLCAEVEPVAFASYVHAPRNVRTSMLELALNIYSHRFTEEELKAIRTSITALNKLAPIRNEIAHGHVSSISMKKQQADGSQTTIAEGNYLLPSLNEGIFHLREFRFHHTAETIHSFQEEVREHRWTIHQAHFSAVMREQTDENEGGPEISAQRAIAVEIASRRIKPANVSRYIKPMIEWDQA